MALTIDVDYSIYTDESLIQRNKSLPIATRTQPR